MATFSKVPNTRAIGAANVVTGACAKYSPSAASARNTAASWGALQAALKAGKGQCTVAQYLALQAKANAGNVGDGLPCLRYWASSGYIKLAA